MPWLSGFFALAKNLDPRLSPTEKKWVENVPKMEEAVAKLRHTGEIGKDVLDAIVEHSGDTYSEWWAELGSLLLVDPVRVRNLDLTSESSKNMVINALYRR